MVGDIVNTSSRIQSANKALGTRILASGAVLAPQSEAPDSEPARYLGRFVLAGKRSPIDLHDYLGPCPPTPAKPSTPPARPTPTTPSTWPACTCASPSPPARATAPHASTWRAAKPASPVSPSPTQTAASS